MERYCELRIIYIKNRTCYYFDDIYIYIYIYIYIIKVKDIDFDNILLDEK